MRYYRTININKHSLCLFHYQVSCLGNKIYLKIMLILAPHSNDTNNARHSKLVYINKVLCGVSTFNHIVLFATSWNKPKPKRIVFSS